MKNPAAKRLRSLLDYDKLFVMLCCHDALSAMLIERNGFAMTFMSGFAVAAYPLALLYSIITAVETSLQSLASGSHPDNLRSFECVREVIGFPEYYREEERYSNR